ncbi:MAG TPA: hypothetical protein VFJ85_08660 [Acidimicrobiales bacterium]|nr:hypothetical protein [Acidimicrobiales bacterium]
MVWHPAMSPFPFDRPLRADEVTGRDAELAALVERVVGGRFVTLIAPRRYGKTSLVNALADHLERTEDLPTLRVDLFGLASMADLAVRLDAAYRAGAAGRLRALLRALLRNLQIDLALGPASVAATFAQDPARDPVPIVHGLLELPRQLATERGSRVLVVVDEFQGIAAVDGADGLVRSHIQHHSAEVSYLFAGSEPHLTELLFSDTARPLYGQAELLTLPPLPGPALAQYIADRFEATSRDAGAGADRIAALTGGHPQRSLLLAHELWERTLVGAPADDEALPAALEAALGRLGGEFTALWAGLAGNEARVLRAVAHGHSPFARSSAALDLKKQSVRHPLTALVRRGVLRSAGAGWELVDPLLALWIRDTFPL